MFRKKNNSDHDVEEKLSHIKDGLFNQIDHKLSEFSNTQIKSLRELINTTLKVNRLFLFQ